MNFAIRFVTEYRYDAPVTDNLNALRVRPATTANQRVDDFHVRTDPEARLARHTDYFGTEVIEFGIAPPHEHLSIDVSARVVTREPPETPAEPWDELATESYAEAAGEYLLPAADEPPDGALDELRSVSRASTPLGTVRLVSELIPDRFTYDQDKTYVGSTVADLLAAGGGVCQDFVHLALMLLRGHGIAARYVSGYLWAAPEEGGDDSVEVETHAWLEALLPGGARGEPMWRGADPTNRRLAGETHVKIGHGRSYADVPPIKGVFRGSATSELEARVTMTRVDREASAGV